MSIQAMVWAINLPLPGHYKMTLVALANYADEDGVVRWKSAKKIAKDAGRSEATVRRQWRELEGAGILVRFEQMRRDGKGQAANEIRLALTVEGDEARRRLLAANIMSEEGDDGDEEAPSPPAPDDT